MWDQAHELGYDQVFLRRAGEFITDDHLPLQKAGLRVIDVIDLTYPPHHTPDDTIDKVSKQSLQVVGDVATALVTGS